MKIVVYGPEKRVGILQGASIVDAARVTASHRGEGKAVPSDLAGFIAAGQPALDACAAALDHAGKDAIAASGSRIHAPRAAEARVACAGANFADHAVRMAAKMRGRDAPVLTAEMARAQQRKEGIRGFWKVNRDYAASGDDVIYPAKARRFDYEGEIAIVIGLGGKDIKPADARRHIWGATLLFDWSIRSPREDNTATRFAMTKNFDTGCSIGPCIAVGELDPFDAEVETLVNGAVRQHFSTREMVYDFAEFIAHLSEDFTLHPGDIISGGTAAGTAADSSDRLPDGSQPNDLFLKPGDRVETKNKVIGSLSARIVAKPA